MARRAKGTGSVRLRPDGRYEGRITIGGTLHSVYGRTESEAHQAIELLRAGTGTPPTELQGELSEDPTLADFLTDWLALRKNHVEANSYQTFSSIVTHHLIPGLGAYRLRALTPLHVETYIAKKLEWGLAKSTIGQHRAVLRMALNHALKWGVVTRNVAKLAEAPQVKGKEMKPLTPEEARKFLAVIQDDWLGLCYVIAATCGLRSAEARALTCGDIDLEKGTVSVNRTMHLIDKEFVVKEYAKTRRSRRVVGLPKLTWDLLVKLKEKRHPESEDELLFRGVRRGKPIHPAMMTKHMQHILRKAGLPRQTFHGLRHLAASLLLASGLSLNDVARTLGHSNIGLTANLYGHWYDESRQRVAESMNRMLGQDTGSDSGSGTGSDRSEDEGLQARIGPGLGS